LGTGELEAVAGQRRVSHEVEGEMAGDVIGGSTKWEQSSEKLNK